MSKEKECVIVEILKGVQEGNLNKAAICGTKQFVCLDDFIETRPFELVKNN